MSHTKVLLAFWNKSEFLPSGYSGPEKKNVNNVEKLYKICKKKYIYYIYKKKGFFSNFCD